MTVRSLARTVVWFALFVFLSACVSDDSGRAAPGANVDVVSGREDYRKNLEDIADRVVLPTYREVLANLQKMASDDTGIQAYCVAIGGSQEATTLADTQGQWRDAMASWQVAEAFLFGPVADNEMSLRNRIYSWPEAISSCGIDRNVQRLTLSSVQFDVSHTVRFDPRAGCLGISLIQY